MKQLFSRALLLFFLFFHCSSHHKPMEVDFGFGNDSYFHQVLTLSMQIWAQLKDGQTLLFSTGDDTLGKLFRMSTYLDQLINHQQVVYKEDKQYLISILDAMASTIRKVDDSVSELPTLLLNLIDEIKAKVGDVEFF